MRAQDVFTDPARQAFFATRRAFRLGRPYRVAADALREACGADARLQLMIAAEESGLSRERVDEIAVRVFGDEPPAPDPDAAAPDAKRVQIKADPGSLTAQIDQTEAALIRAELGLYQRGGALFRLGWTDAGDTEAMRVVPVDERGLYELVDGVTEWFRYDARAHKYLPTPPPREVVAGYLARAGLGWRVPRLTAVIEATTLRADGSILAQPGHDAATGLYLAPGECHAFPGLASKRAADRAADDLAELLEGFPFVGDADLSVALAAILTAAIRRALPTAPLFAFTAPAPGTGKSLLADIVAAIATGQPAKSLTWTGDPAEDRKALDAALLEGAPIVSLDNVTAALGGDRLNQMLTQGAATVRVLGQSKNVEVACDSLVLANGNNLAIAADLTRRTMLCRLDARVERPELRQFRTNPLDMIRRDRGRYLSAALTILAAYDAAGRPGKPKPLGSFEAWSDWVRGAVMWPGFADPLATQEAAREVDPRGAELAAVLGQWNEHVGHRHVTAAEVIAAAVQAGEFREALLSVAGRGGAINSHRLGNWLHAHKGRLVGAVRLEHAGKTRTGAALWTLSGGRSATAVVGFDGREFLEAAK